MDKCVSCKCMSEMGFSAVFVFLFFFVLLCFPIQQFNEKLKDQTSNPWQQPRNPRFVMLSMLHCKQIQTAPRQQTLKRSIKLYKVIALENTEVFSLLTQTDCPFKSK